ncbi:hypothetical protein Y1Q_0018201 [Alligator mississippiensis]|uniref:Uncharacterized protein n=1 Tax=Alligator mississippiensis TaxID=8496 RepID=A0A151MRK0_ALLMI|nr:hypothetical protein Y1Q_0018201 [Alligator mississippiensis]
MVAKVHLADTRAQRLEDVTHKDTQDQCKEERDQWRDQADQEFRESLLALEEWHAEALEQQASPSGQAVETTEDHGVLDTILALVVAFVPPTALFPAAATCHPAADPLWA